METVAMARAALAAAGFDPFTAAMSLENEQ